MPKSKNKTKEPKAPPPPAPPVNVMPLPAYVDDPVAIAEFKRCVKDLGRLTPQDASLLADYANTFAQCIKLQKDVDKEGYKLVGPKGGEYLNPSVTLLMHKQGLLKELRRDLFFTPKSRTEKPPKPIGKVVTLLEDINNDNQ